MTKITVRSAPRAASKLTKSTGHTRRLLTEASKAEQQGTAGATAERQRLTADFQRRSDETARLIHATEQIATQFERATLIAKTRSTDPTHSTDPLSTLTAAAVRLGCDTNALGVRLDHTAQRALSAAQQAQDRLDREHDDLLAVAYHAQGLALLANAGFQRTAASKAAFNRGQSLRKKQ